MSAGELTPRDALRRMTNVPQARAARTQCARDTAIPGGYSGAQGGASGGEYDGRRAGSVRQELERRSQHRSRRRKNHRQADEYQERHDARTPAFLARAKESGPLGLLQRTVGVGGRDFRHVRFHQITANAYCRQYQGTPSPQAIRSVAAAQAACKITIVYA